MILNKTGYSHAKTYIKEGKVDKDSSWSFSAADGNKLLGPNGDNWSEYKKWFLGLDDKEKEDTKAHYHFPIGKNDKIYRKGVIAAKQRAAQFKYSEIEDAADKLLKMIDGKSSDWYQLKVNSDSGEVEALIYGDIGWDVSAEDFIKEVKSLNPSSLSLRINSFGGSVFEGLAIYNYLKGASFDVTCHIDGLAASAASVIACSGKVVMPKNAFFMIHNPSSMVAGESGDMRKQADVMDKIRDSIVSVYHEKSGLSNDEIIAMMDAETWLNGEQAKEKGFCDEVIGPVENFKRFNVSGIYENIPAEYIEKGDCDMLIKKVEALAKSMKLSEENIETLKKGLADYNKEIMAKMEELKRKDGEPSKKNDGPSLPEDVVKQLNEYKEKIASLETANFVKDISGKVGEDVAMLLGKMYHSVDKEVLNKLIEKVEGMRKTIDDLGKAKGTSDTDGVVNDVTTDDIVEKKVQEIVAKDGCSSVEALNKLAIENPKLVANWR